VVHDLVLNLEKADKWVRKDDTCLEFSVKSTYVILKGDFERDHLLLFKAFGGLKLYLQLFLFPGGCWKIILLLKLI